MIKLQKSFILLIGLLFLSPHEVNAQDGKAAGMFWLNGEYDASLKNSIAAIQKDSLDAEAYLVAGRSLATLNKNDSAILYLEKAKQIKTAPPYVKAWAAFELSGCYFLLNDIKKARANNEECLKLNATKNSTEAANARWATLGFDTKMYSNWVTKETEHLIFHFQDTVFKNGLANFLNVFESGFDSINSFFGAKLPKKIDLYVWQDDEHAFKLLGKQLAFTKSSLCVTHTSAKHTVGHEMTHSISHYAVASQKTTTLISEGVCVAFDLSGRNNFTLLKENKQVITSVSDIWRNSNKVTSSIVYPLGGELVKRLIQTFGKEKFMQLLANQTYESAQKIYGADLDILLKIMDDELSLTK